MDKIYYQKRCFSEYKNNYQFKSQTRPPCPSHQPTYDGTRPTGPFAASPNPRPVKVERVGIKLELDFG